MTILELLSKIPHKDAPLAQQVRDATGVPRHPGLVHAKLIGPVAADVRSKSQEAHGDPWKTLKRPILDRIVEMHRGWLNSENRLVDEVAARVRAAAKSLSEVEGAKLFELPLKLRGRVTSRLGESHPLESGFMFHPLLGIPWIPGSGLKGAVRYAYWVRFVATVEPARAEDARQEMEWLFGSASEPLASDSRLEAKDEKHRRGAAIFFDVLPGEKGLSVEVDIVNPHFKNYYERKLDGATDGESPVPNFFLAAGGTADWTAAVVVLPRPGGPRDAAGHLREAMVDCLATWGVGAKTSSGYGVFAIPGERQGTAANPGQVVAAGGGSTAPASLRPVQDAWTDRLRALRPVDWGNLRGLIGEVEGSSASVDEKQDRLRRLAARATELWGGDRARLRALRQDKVLGKFLESSA